MSLFSCGFQGELLFDRFLIIWSQRSSSIAIYDVERRRLLHLLVHLPSPDHMVRVSLARDLKSLLKVDRDGSFQLIELQPDVMELSGDQSDAEEDPKINKLPVLLSGRVVDDEVAIWTRTGHFDTTAEGAAQIAIRFPGLSGEYTLEQFRRFLHVDNLLRRVLAGERFAPPVVRDVPPTIKVTPSFAPGTVAAKVLTAGDEAVSEVRVYQDGTMTDAIPMPPAAKSLDVNVKRLPGSRWVAFLARGASGLYSQPASFDAGQGQMTRRRLYLISIGIDHYDDDLIPTLRFAGSDAARFSKALQESAGGVFEIVSQSLLLTSRQAARPLSPA